MNPCFNCQVYPSTQVANLSTDLPPYQTYICNKRNLIINLQTKSKMSPCPKHPSCKLSSPIKLIKTAFSWAFKNQRLHPGANFTKSGTPSPASIKTSRSKAHPKRRSLVRSSSILWMINLTFPSHGLRWPAYKTAVAGTPTSIYGCRPLVSPSTKTKRSELPFLMSTQVQPLMALWSVRLFITLCSQSTLPTHLNSTELI